jgi:hypothetical protein
LLDESFNGDQEVSRDCPFQREHRVEHLKCPSFTEADVVEGGLLEVVGAGVVEYCTVTVMGASTVRPEPLSRGTETFPAYCLAGQKKGVHI